MKTIHAVATIAAIALTSACASASTQDGMAMESGAELWRTTCSHCHNLREAPEFTAQQWPVIVNHMRTKARLSRADAEAIAAYLVRLTE